MMAAELPESNHVTQSADVNKIAQALREIFNGSRYLSYRYETIISGEPNSGFVFSPEPYKESYAFEVPFFPTKMALRLHNNKWQYIYPPKMCRGEERGLEVRKAITEDGVPIAIVWAVRVDFFPPMPVYF
jgi:hypothetical protein